MSLLEVKVPKGDKSRSYKWEWGEICGFWAGVRGGMRVMNIRGMGVVGGKKGGEMKYPHPVYTCLYLSFLSPCILCSAAVRQWGSDHQAIPGYLARGGCDHLWESRAWFLAVDLVLLSGVLTRPIGRRRSIRSPTTRFTAFVNTQPNAPPAIRTRRYSSIFADTEADACRNRYLAFSFDQNFVFKGCYTLYIIHDTV
jgi:hypothetical protein